MNRRGFFGGIAGLFGSAALPWRRRQPSKPPATTEVPRIVNGKTVAMTAGEQIWAGDFVVVDGAGRVRRASKETRLVALESSQATRSVYVRKLRLQHPQRLFVPDKDVMRDSRLSRPKGATPRGR